MSYSEDCSETFYHFSGTEDDIIQKFLTKRGYTWNHNTVCGNCCGMYADEYWVDGIGGNFKKKDKLALYKLLKKEKIACSIGGYTISADPSYEEEYQIKDRLEEN